MPQSSGLFITFEGGEGSGKTTQIQRLKSAIEEQGHHVTLTREPGGTPEAEIIRGCLVSRDGGNWSPEAEVLMLYAARSMHLQTVILPALTKEHVVICDRFSDSTLAYQGYGHGYDFDRIRALDDLIVGANQPDLTFILDIDPKVGLMRSKKRMMETNDLTESQEDRFERLGLSFHQKLRDGFLSIAQSAPDRCCVINAEQNLDAVTHDIWSAMKGRLTS